MYKGDSMEEKFAMDKFVECVLVYTSDVEKELFENYILDNWDKVNQSINENNAHLFGTEHLSQLVKEDIIDKFLDLLSSRSSLREIETNFIDADIMRDSSIN